MGYCGAICDIFTVSIPLTEYRKMVYLDILKEQKFLLFLYSMIPYTLPNLKISSKKQIFQYMKQ